MRFLVGAKLPVARINKSVQDGIFNSKMQMTPLILFLCAFSAAGLVAGATHNSSQSGDAAGGAIEEKLYQMEREWADAMMKNDASVIERIEADEYTYIMDDMTGDKKGDLAEAKSSAFTGSAELSELKARVFGDAAVVTGKASLLNATYKGKNISGNYLFTDTFVKRNGRWQVVASHSNKIQKM
jgi:ketosteroid isomerase-like protein